MRYIDWVDTVLLKIEELANMSPNANLIGVGREELAAALGGSRHQHDFGQALYAALQDLGLLLCVEADGPFVRLTTQGHQVARAGSFRPGWKSIFKQVRLLPEHVQILAKAVEMAERQHDGFAVMEMVDVEQVLAAVGQPADRATALAVLRALEAAGCVGDKQDASGPPPLFRPSYAGVVVSTQKLATELQTLLAHLVEEWETTSVEFKEVIGLQSPTEKGEFVKDVLALATTRVSGHRFLGIGFNDKTRLFTTSVDPRLTDHRMESILGVYADPVPRITYATVPWEGGKAGLIEVFSDARDLPYKVNKNIGKYRAGQVFVRHNSLVEEPSALELRYLIDEGRRARGEA